MNNPIVDVDFTNYDDIFTNSLPESYNGKFKAEILMINCNKDNVRGRILDPITGQVLLKNHNFPSHCIVNDTIVIENN